MIAQEELASSFQARHLAVPIGDAVAVAPDTSVRDAYRDLSANGFDQAPVIERGTPVGYVLTRDLPGRPDGETVERSMTALGSGNVVSANASIGSMLEWVVETGFLFVLEGRDITGFVTVSDFNKQPARGHLYLLLARLETGLAELIRDRFATDAEDLVKRLSPGPRREIESSFQGDRAAGIESELVAYLDFSDLVRVVGGVPELLTRIGGRSPGQWKRQTGGLVDLRNQVMHPVRNVVLAKDGLISLRDRVRRLESLIVDVETALAL